MNLKIYRLSLAHAALACACMFVPLQVAGQTDLANAPVFITEAAKPNVMLVPDDSTGMAFEWLPDPASLWQYMYGRFSAQCNGMAFNPDFVYLPPKRWDGTSEPHADKNEILSGDPLSRVTSPRTITVSGAPVATNYGASTASAGWAVTVPDTARAAGWYPSGTLVVVYDAADRTRYYEAEVLSWSRTTGVLRLNVAGVSVPPPVFPMTSPRVAYGRPVYDFYYKYTGTLPAMSWRYDDTGTIVWGDAFRQECISHVLGGGVGAGKFTRERLTNSHVNAQNYANWYQYYRDRVSTVRTLMTLALDPLDDSYRIGLSLLNNKGVTEPADGLGFVHIRDFDVEQRKKVFKAVREWTATGGDTPTRNQIAKIGRYYAASHPEQRVTTPDKQPDPIQYSCQRNYAILATDGMWTSGSSSDPPIVQLDGTTAIGNQDGAPTPRPMFDFNAQSNLLSDVTAYYYNTDLRDGSRGNCTGALGLNVCTNNVPGAAGTALAPGDSNPAQHMTFFAISLGVDGQLKYKPDYPVSTTGDYADIALGPRNWPNVNMTNVTQWGSPPAAIDDTWHAAVNGRGRYFNASEPAGILRTLQQALDLTKGPVDGAGAAATVSTFRPTDSDKDVFLGRFTSMQWTGDLMRRELVPSTGEVTTSTADWSAAEKLRVKAPTGTRKIYFAGSGGARAEFTVANLTAAGKVSHFKDFCTKPGAGGAPAPSQCSAMNDADKTAANTADNLVAYLRGERNPTYYRARDGILGPIINSQPAFVGKPPFRYTENSYSTFAGTSRTSVVLAAANDGMLHAFDRASGEELWAYIPSMVLPNLYRLADDRHRTRHSYFVDGTPVVGDVYTGTAWRTIVVGGLNAGGKGYYALDVTNPADPRLLWEFTDARLGFSFGNPIITKRANGTWVVVFASGYNNADGRGYLFVRNAFTGAEELTLDTGVGTLTAPSGLARINAWVDSEQDNTAKRIFGGDLLGNVWRFDLDSSPNIVKLAELKTADGTPAPVTTKPALAEVKHGGQLYPVVIVTSGRYLALSDVADRSKQSVFVFKDRAASYGDIRPLLQAQTISDNADGSKSISGAPVNWAAQVGWRADLTIAGERVTVDANVVLNTLYVASNVPSPEACSRGGSSFLYKFNLSTGAPADGSRTVAVPQENLTVGVTLINTQDSAGGPGRIAPLMQSSDGKPPRPGARDNLSSIGKSVRRTGWRELRN